MAASQPEVIWFLKLLAHMKIETSFSSPAVTQAHLYLKVVDTCLRLTLEEHRGAVGGASPAHG